MSTPSRLGGFERFSERKDVTTTLTSISDSFAGLSEDLGDISPDYDSSLVFSYTDGSAVANPLATIESTHSLWYRHRFRKENIENSLVTLSGTRLGQVLRNPKETGYGISEINNDMPQIVYTERLIHDDELVGAIQHSFTPSSNDGAISFLPDNADMELITGDHSESLEQTAARVALLQSMGKKLGSLGLLLEQEQAIAPDATIIRVDGVDSRHYMLSSQQAAYDAYQNQSQVFLDELINDYEQRYLYDQYGIKAGYSDQGDGAYIILPLPEAYNPYNPHVLKYYKQYSVDPFIEDMRQGLDAIALQYKNDLVPLPRVHISSGFGNISVNGKGRLISPVMTALALNKQK